jgi:hypothetical protein
MNHLAVLRLGESFAVEIQARPWKRGSDCRSVSHFHDFFNSASERPSTPSEADDHHDESAGGCALQ